MVKIKLRGMLVEESKKISANLAKMEAKDAEEKSERTSPKEAEKSKNVLVAKRKSRKSQWNLAGVEVRVSEIRGHSTLNLEHGERLLGLQKQGAFCLGLRR